MDSLVGFIARAVGFAGKEVVAAELKYQAGLLRCIFGNPFRPVNAMPAWLGWNSGTAVKMAESIYDERDFSKAPLLADMLEDAGCSDGAILEHLRGPGPHGRGCWVVDALLGME